MYKTLPGEKNLTAPARNCTKRSSRSTGEVCPVESLWYSDIRLFKRITMKQALKILRELGYEVLA
ncbi:MAG: hypothetical protein Q6363_003305 [Candidatus Njordarchaeota archaeon]